MIVYDYVNTALSNTQKYVDSADKLVDNSLKASEFDMTTYFTCAEKDALNTVDLWSKEYQQILHDAEMRSFGYLYEEEDKVEEYQQCAYGDVDQGLETLEDAADDIVTKADDGIITYVDGEENKAKDELEHAEQEGPGFWGNLWDATVGLPGVLVNIGKIIDSFVNMDPEKFIDDNIELARAQKKLQKRLQEEEI